MGGTGYTVKHAMSHQQHWGENRLGKALMVAREHLQKEVAVPLAADATTLSKDVRVK
jgi:hypothetical protein